MFGGKVGTGFNETTLKTLYSRLSQIPSATCPFADVAQRGSGSRTQGLTRAQMRRSHWVKPELVCQVKFSEWTQDGKLRQPVFLGLREDTVNVYSLRAKSFPSVSTPVRWQEVETAMKKKAPKDLTFDASEVLKRVQKHGDLLAPVLKLKQSLPAGGRGKLGR